MRNPETGPDHSGDNKDEIITDFPTEKISDREYQARTLLGHQKARLALEKELWECEAELEKSTTSAQKKQLEEKIEGIRTKIANAAKDKAQVEARFQESKEEAA